MKRLMCLSMACAIVLAMALVAQARKPKADPDQWLGRYSEPAAINVDGVWQSKEWGRVILKQSQGSNLVSGTGDGWDIRGVASGTKVLLLFTHKGRVGYSAELNGQVQNKLMGSYAKDLMSEGSKLRPMTLSK